MSDLSADLAQRALDCPWQLVALACASCAAAAWCFVAAGLAPSRAWWWCAMGGCAAMLALGLTLAVLGTTQYGRWRLERWASSVSERVTRRSWERALQVGPHAASMWLNDARSLNAAVVSLCESDSRAGGDRALMAFPAVLDTEVCRQLLELGATVASDRLARLPDADRVLGWKFELLPHATEAGQAGPGAYSLRIAGEPGGFGSPSGALTLPSLRMALVIHCVELREADGEWRTILEGPVTLGDSRMIPIAECSALVEGAPGGELRCRGEVVVSSFQIPDARSVPFEWRRKVP